MRAFYACISHVCMMNNLHYSGGMAYKLWAGISCVANKMLARRQAAACFVLAESTAPQSENIASSL